MLLLQLLRQNMLSKGTLYIREVLVDASSANVLLPISKVTRASQDKAGLAPWLISIAPFVVALEEEPVSLIQPQRSVGISQGMLFKH